MTACPECGGVGSGCRCEREHHPDCPAPHFPDRTDRCRCIFMAMLDRPHRMSATPTERQPQ